VAFGAMIGFGWVVLTGGFLGDAGSLGAALAFVIGGIVVGLVGLTYAELVSAMPRAGGEHNYALRGLGARLAFVTSWALGLGYVSVVAFEAVALPTTMAYLFPELESAKLWTISGGDVYAPWVAVGVVGAVAIAGLNFVGVRPASVFQGIAVLFLVAVGAALLLGSLTGGSRGNLDPLFSGGVDGLLAVLVATPFLFVGFDVIPQSAEEIDLPYRQIGKVLLVSVALATCWYILVMLTVGSALSRGTLVDAELAAADGMTALWDSDVMGDVLILGGIAGILTSWNAFMIGVSRLLFAMARSGMLPAWLGHVHPRFRTPANAVLLVGGLSVLAPLFGEQMLTWLVDAGSLNIVIAYFLVACTFLALRRREPGMERPFRVRWGAAVGALAAALSLGMAILFLPGMPSALIWPEEWIIVGLWWIAGAALLLRVPRVGAGAEAEDRLVEATASRFTRTPARDEAPAGRL
jgi:basic amino acid/polyamine antiporter, APA family